MDTFVVHTSGVLELSDEELFRLCAANRHLFIERDAGGNLIFMAPSGGATSSRNTDIVTELKLWNRAVGAGRVFGPDAGFLLSNGAMRAPDAAWIPEERWEQLSPEQRERFLPLCPDFIVELRSPSDRVETLQEKMQEWAANGCRLGWLVDPFEQQAIVYRREEDEPEVLQGFDGALDGEDVLSGFELNLNILK